MMNIDWSSVNNIDINIESFNIVIDIIQFR